MQAELERLAGVAVSHGPDDPAIEVFLAFVGALDPLPDATDAQAGGASGSERRGSCRLSTGPARLASARVGCSQPPSLRFRTLSGSWRDSS